MKEDFITLCGGDKPAQEKEFSSKLWKDKNKLLQFFKDCYYDIDKPINSNEPFYMEMCLYHRERLKFILQHIKPAKNEIFLDIGCGIGGLSYNIAVRGGITYAADISKESLGFAKEINKDYRNLKLLFSDGLNICFKEQTFDKVVCADVIEHLNCDEKIILFNEVNRVLKKNGKFYLHTPNINRAILGLFFRKIKAFFKGNFSKETIAFSNFEGGHIGLVNSQQLIKLLKTCGFNAKIFYFGAKIPCLYKHFNALDNLLGAKLPIFNDLFSFSILVEGVKNNIK